MTVRELQQRLSELDPELGVVCYSEDAELLQQGRAFVLFNVESVETTEAERLRLDDQTPYLKLGKGPLSTRLASLLVTTDF